MKRLLLFALLIPCFSFGQKLERPDIEKISGDTTYKTTIVTFATDANVQGGAYLSIGCEKTKLGYKLIARFSLAGKRTRMFSLPKDGDLTLKFKNGSVAKLIALVNQLSNYETNSTTAYQVYTIKQEDLTTLRDNPVSAVSIELLDGNEDFNVSDRKSTLIQKELGLLN